MSLLCDKCTGTGRLRSIGGLNKECDQCFGTKVFIAKAEEKVEEKVIDMKEAEVNETLEKVVEIENKTVKTVKRGRKKLDEVLKSMGKIDEHAA